MPVEVLVHRPASVLLPLLILGLQPHNKRAMLFDKTAQIVFTEFAGKKSVVLRGGIAVDLFSYVVMWPPCHQLNHFFCMYFLL